MARFYRLWVKYPPVANTEIYSETPPDFASGDHGFICFNYDAERWYAPTDGISNRLARQYLAATDGLLAEGIGSAQSEMYDGGRLIGLTSVEIFRHVNFHGSIGLNPTSGLFARVLYFTREPTWADRSLEDKMRVIIEHSAKYASGEAHGFIMGLIPMILQFAAVSVLLVALGEFAAPWLALVIGIILGVSMVFGRGGEYAGKLGEINNTLNSTTANERDIDDAGRAFAEFIRMLVEDTLVVLGAAGIRALRNAFARGRQTTAAGAKSQVQTAPSGKPGALSPNQVYVGCAEGFKGMPKFSGASYSEIVTWLEANGFKRIKIGAEEEAKTFPGQMKVPSGGSEIWFRRRGAIAQAGMTEAVRLDVLGHDMAFAGKQIKGSPTKLRLNVWPAKTKLPIFPGMKFSMKGLAGFEGHFHKEIISTTIESNYLQESTREKLDFNDEGTRVEFDKSEAYYQKVHIPIERTNASIPSGKPSLGPYPSQRI